MYAWKCVWYILRVCQSVWWAVGVSSLPCLMPHMEIPLALQFISLCVSEALRKTNTLCLLTDRKKIPTCQMRGFFDCLIISISQDPEAWSCAAWSNKMLDERLRRILLLFNRWHLILLLAAFFTTILLYTMPRAFYRGAQSSSVWQWGSTSR